MEFTAVHGPTALHGPASGGRNYFFAFFFATFLTAFFAAFLAFFAIVDSPPSNLTHQGGQGILEVVHGNIVLCFGFA